MFPPLAFPQSYCVFYLLERGRYCWPSHNFYCGESNNTGRASFSLPATGQGSHHPGSSCEDRHHLWLAWWWCRGCTIRRSVQELPCAMERQTTGFSLAHLGKLPRSTAHQLNTRSQEKWYWQQGSEAVQVLFSSCCFLGLR